MTKASSARFACALTAAAAVVMGLLVAPTSNAAAAGADPVSVTIDGAPIDPDKTYVVAGSTFLLGGGDQAPEPSDEALSDLLSIARARTPLATVRWLNELIPDRFAYRPGVTYVGSTIDDLLRAGAGVCQDFVHLALDRLRIERVIFGGQSCPWCRREGSSLSSNAYDRAVQFRSSMCS